MNPSAFRKWIGLISLLAILAAFLPARVSSHCDTMNGPVVTAAKKALETGNVNLVLIWVQKKDEAEIREAFKKTLAVRKLNSDARNLADMYFFETLVRVHRAGEGVAYTGLKPAETEAEPGITAADKALETGSVKPLLQHLSESIHHTVESQYKGVMEKKRFKPDDVEAGREYVAAYVRFIHSVEAIHQAILQPAEGHGHELQKSDVRHHDH